jgi:TetR/AcrR family transcriptional regulator
MQQWPAPISGPLPPAKTTAAARRVRSAPRTRLTTEARRQQLIDTASRVFAERGFRGTTTREIAGAAGVTEAVIFQHFPDKDSLYAAILAQKAADPDAEAWFGELHAASAAGDDVLLLRRLYTGLLEQHERDPGYLRLTLFSALEHHPLAAGRHAFGTRLYRLLDRHIRAAQRAGRFRQGSSAVLVRAVLAIPVYHVLQLRVLQAPWPAVERTQIIDEGVRFALGGLLAGAAPREVHS